MRPTCSAGLATAIFASSAAAELRTYTGPGGPISDLATQRFTIFVADHGPANVDSIASDLHHTWAGDLFVTVRHDDYSVTLMDRLGAPNSTRDNSDDLIGTYIFRDGYAPMPESWTAEGVILPGTYGPHRHEVVSRSVEDMFGVWTFTVIDAAGGDVGQVGWWSFTVDTVPAPSALMILVLFGSRRSGR
jgi:hypothetical protein